MFENFDPKEKKVIIIFLALLILGLVYVGTHDLNLGGKDQFSPNSVPLEEEASSSGRYL